MSRQTDIKKIESLYPADSDSIDTRKLGTSLLLAAISKEWRLLPNGVLEEYARLCEREDAIKDCCI